MNMKEVLIKELVKKGYANIEGGKAWDLSNRDLLYITDALANGFLRLRSHPRYLEIVVNKELDLIKKYAEDCSQNGGEAFNLIDIGCGDGTKARAFLQVLKHDCKIRYCPVNVNKFLVELALKNVKDTGTKHIKAFNPIIARFTDVSEVLAGARNSEYPKNLVLLLGSIIASYEINDYLFNLSRAMFPGDCLIIGNGIRTGERFVNLDAYKHPIFSQWFGHLVRELGFKDEEVEYNARFTNKRVEGYYRVRVDKEVEHDGKKIEFKRGDEIIVAALYKFYEEELEKFCKMYFSDVKIMKDPEQEYVLIVCNK